MPVTLNDSIQSNSPKPLDNKYAKFVSGATVSYASVAEANSLINEAYRSVGLTVLVDDGTGVNVEYWYKDATSNSSLVLKTQAGIDSFSAGTDVSRNIKQNTFVKRILIKPDTSLAAFAAGTSPGEDDYTGDISIPLTGGVWFNLEINQYFESGDTIHFSGITDLTNFKIFYE